MLHMPKPKPLPVYPRVGGGNQAQLGYGALRQGLSPRGRGKPTRRIPAPIRARSIPAWAGETEVGHRLTIAKEVYPRVGGGNEAYECTQLHPGGLSPRGRGKQALWRR